MQANKTKLSAGQIYKRHMRKTYIINGLWFFLAALLIVVWLWTEAVGKINTAAFICICIVTLFIAFIIAIITGIWFNNLYKIVFNECDPEKFVEVMKLLQPKIFQWKSEKTTFYIAIAYGQYYSGNFQEALDLIKSVHVVHYKGGNRIMYYGILGAKP